MSKSIKFNDNVYLDSSSISHNKQDLHDYLENKDIFKNLFNFNNLSFSTTPSPALNYEEKSITVHKYSNATNVALKYLCPNLKAGKTYTLSFETTSTSKYIYLHGSLSTWSNGTSKTLTQADLDGGVNFYGNYIEGDPEQMQTISDIQIEEKPYKTSYKQFTGYIEDSGNNSNGSWIKFSDGTMICRGRKKIASCSITVAWGNAFYYKGRFDNYPQSFVSEPDVFVENGGNETGNSCWCSRDSYGSTLNNAGDFRIYRFSQATTTNQIVSYMAIGKWK